MSNVTGSPSCNESKSTVVSSVRWKNTSFPSSARTNPNPRSGMIFLMRPSATANLQGVMLTTICTHLCCDHAGQPCQQRKPGGHDGSIVTDEKERSRMLNSAYQGGPLPRHARR